MKRILFYLGHPAQFHFSKHIIRKLKEDGNEVKILIKTKDILENLLKEEGMEYENIQTQQRKNSQKAILLASLKRTVAVYKKARNWKADILIGTDSSIAQAAWLMRKPALTVLEDDVEIIKNLAKLTYPFTTNIVVPEPCRVGKWENKKIPYYGYMKLAYLHPNYFKPDHKKLEEYNISDKFCLIRLAKLTAHHDAGIKGLNSTMVNNVIKIASEHGYKTYISAEDGLDDSLKPYQLKIKNKDIHHIMAFASLLISDSQSMSVEAAMLGTPSLRFSDFSGRISVLEELEQKYKLTFGIKTTEIQQLLDMTTDFLSDPALKTKFQERRKLMLNDKIDVTAFFVWLIENYPESREVMKQDTEYQKRFK